MKTVPPVDVNNLNSVAVMMEVLTKLIKLEPIVDVYIQNLDVVQIKKLINHLMENVIVKLVPMDVVHKKILLNSLNSTVINVVNFPIMVVAVMELLLD